MTPASIDAFIASKACSSGVGVGVQVKPMRPYPTSEISSFVIIFCFKRIELIDTIALVEKKNGSFKVKKEYEKTGLAASLNIY